MLFEMRNGGWRAKPIPLKSTSVADDPQLLLGTLVANGGGLMHELQRIRPALRTPFTQRRQHPHELQRKRIALCDGCLQQARPILGRIGRSAAKHQARAKFGLRARVAFLGGLLQRGEIGQGHAAILKACAWPANSVPA